MPDPTSPDPDGAHATAGTAPSAAPGSDVAGGGASAEAAGAGPAPGRDDATEPLPVGAADLPIPMLTEIVEVPRYAPEDLPETLEAVDWAELADRVRENVTERLSRRSQALLDAALRDSLRAVVDRAAESLAAELRTSLSQMVRDIVGRAVDEEITRVHAEIARRTKP
ncbi:MAG: hypothetical protein WCK28_10395 [Burkholderiales bacterium]|jgi:hypothetical protein